MIWPGRPARFSRTGSSVAGRSLVRAHALLVAIAVLVGASAAAAGPPKGQAVKSVRIDGRHHVIADTSVSGVRGIRVVLAQISAPARFRARPNCSAQSTQTAIARLAVEMRLDDAVEITTDRRLIPTAYLSRPLTGRFSVQQSLNYRVVRQGLSRVTSRRGAYRQTLLRAQSAARRSHRGIWSRCK